MRTPKAWLFSTFLMAALAGVTLLLTTTSPSQAQPARAEARREVAAANYWRHHDGRWSHWDARDKRWYYTDGQHWYYHTGRNWEVYRFDKTFGREFQRGQYQSPGEATRIVVPRHEVYIPR